MQVWHSAGPAVSMTCQVCSTLTAAAEQIDASVHDCTALWTPFNCVNASVLILKACPGWAAVETIEMSCSRACLWQHPRLQMRWCHQTSCLSFPCLGAAAMVSACKHTCKRLPCGLEPMKDAVLPGSSASDCMLRCQ